MTNVPKDLITAVETKILDTFILAQEKFSRTFEVPKLSFDLNSLRIAGQASYRSNHIKINPQYLIQHPDEMVNRTVGHECGHLITHIVFPTAKQAHGPEFRHVMRSLGLPESRCHSMTLLDPKTPHLYRCACQEFYFSNCRHTRSYKRGAYRCPKCKTNLVYVRTLSSEDFLTQTAE